jgi:hypothetical protein
MKLFGWVHSAPVILKKIHGPASYLLSCLNNFEITLQITIDMLYTCNKQFRCKHSMHIQK